MKRKNKSHKQDIFYQYLLTYFIVLFIPLTICSAYCIRMLAVISRDDIQASEAELQHAAVLVDNMLDEVTDLGNLLAVNTQVNSFRYKQDIYQYPYSYEINKLQQALPKVYQASQLVFDYFIFFNQSEMVINPFIAYTYEDFYSLYLRKDCYADYGEWLQAIKGSRPGYGLEAMETYIWQGKQKQELLVYTQPLPNADDNSALRIYFRNTVLEQQLPAMDTGSIQYVENGKKALLYYNTDLEEVDYSYIRDRVDSINWEGLNIQDRVIKIGKEDYFAVQYRSDASGLTFTVLQPETVVNSRKISGAVTLMLLILLAVTVGIALSYRMVKKTTTPITDILKEVSLVSERAGEGQSAFTILRETFRDLCGTNSTMAEGIERQKLYIRNSFLNKLVYGDIISEEEALQLADSLELDLRKRVFSVLLFHYEPGEDFTRKNEELIGPCIILLTEVLEQLQPGSLYASLGADQVALLFCVQSKDRETLRNAAKSMICRLRNVLPPDVSENLAVYGGSESDCLLGIHESYNDAVFLSWGGKEHPEGEIIWHNRENVNVPMYPPVDFGGKLAYYVASGDTGGLHDELENVLKQYIFDHNLPVYLQHMLLNELQIVLFRTLSRIRMKEDEYSSYCLALEENKNAPLLGQISAILNLFKSLCEYVGRQKQTQETNTVAASAVSYIDLNYMNDSLSLTEVADHYHIGESALSGLFKQSMGVTFSAYVENVRIEKARGLLKTTELSVREIAEAVGYSSVNSFCRAFKRVTGKNATACR